MIEAKQKTTAECLIAIAKACNRIKRNLEFNKVVINAVNDMDNAVGQLEGIKV